tara:strand:- start:584 stop:961 length:378 start_codon:yes stop_codon:yes gene_type:complete
MNNTYTPPAEQRALYHLEHLKDRIGTLAASVIKMEDAVRNERWEEAVATIPSLKMLERRIDTLTATLKELSPDIWVAVWHEQATGRKPSAILGPAQLDVARAFVENAREERAAKIVTSTANIWTS